MLAPLAAMAIALGVLTPMSATAATTPTRVMIIGDSISQGSTGDYTWRYRLWKNFAAGSVDFVGPRKNLFDNAYDDWKGTHRNANDLAYADPNFDQDHDAVWGRMLGVTQTFDDPMGKVTYNMGDEVAAAKPDVVIVELGVNNLTLASLAKPPLPLSTIIANQKEALLATIAAIRANRPGVSIVLGQLIPNEVTSATVMDAANAMYSEVVQAKNTASERIILAGTHADFDPATDTWEGVHPNARGEFKIAAAFTKALATLGLPVAVKGSLSDVKMQAVPATPAITSVSNPTDHTVRVSWNPVPNAFGYWVDKYDGGTGTWQRMVFAEPWAYRDDSGLVSGEHYEYRVTAVGKGGLSGTSAAAAFTASGITPGGTTLSASAGDSRVSLRWDAAKNSDGVQLQVRTLRSYDTNGWTDWSTAPMNLANGWGTSSSPYSYPGAEDGVRYQFRVRPVNGKLVSSIVSNVVDVTPTGAAPPAPTASVTQSSSDITISWKSVGSTYTYLAEYRDLSTDGAWKFAQWWPTPATSQTIGALLDHHRYEVRVRAYRQSQAGPASAAVSFYYHQARYVAIGDSYSSGTGAGSAPADFETDTTAYASSPWRSKLSFTHLLAQRHDLYLDNFTWHGAETPAITEQAKLIPSDTAYVTITAGGNDLGFKTIAESCIHKPWSLKSNDAIAEDCRSAMSASEAMVRNGTLAARLDKVYAAVQASAPHAKVVVVGYPSLFDPNSTLLEACGAVFHFDYPGRAGRLSIAADTVIATEAARYGFTVVNPTDSAGAAQWAGHHECESDSWIRGVSVDASLTGKVMANPSFHPVAAAYSTYFTPAIEKVLF